MDSNAGSTSNTSLCHKVSAGLSQVKSQEDKRSVVVMRGGEGGTAGLICADNNDRKGGAVLMIGMSRLFSAAWHFLIRL